MKKLGLSREGQLEVMDFEKYVGLFNEGLSEQQAQLILELIKCDDVASVEPLGVEWSGSPSGHPQLCLAPWQKKF
jgi:hypothetical protein